MTGRVLAAVVDVGEVWGDIYHLRALVLLVCVYWSGMGTAEWGGM